MTAAREDIYAALLTLLQAAAPFQTISRRVRLWSDLSAAQQPALFLVAKGEDHAPQTGLPPRRTLQADLVVYALAPDDDTAGSQVLNPLLDALQTALRPPPYSADQTLGGLVQHAWIEGHIQTDEGALGPQAVAVIPVHILAP